VVTQGEGREGGGGFVLVALCCGIDPFVYYLSVDGCYTLSHVSNGGSSE